VGQGTFQPRIDMSGYGATFMRKASILTMSCIIFLLGYAVESGATSEIDRAVLIHLREPGDLAVPIGPPWLLDVARDVTSFGSTSVTLSIMTLAALAALLWRRMRTALFVLAAIGAGSALVNLVKLMIRRVRPDVVPHLTSEVTFSFPSSHAAVSVMTYGALALLAVRDAPQLSPFAYGAAGLCVIAIGVTRLYLGVHYPTDVLSGWLFGMTWLLVCRSAFDQHWVDQGKRRSR
jgi:undecaprenyl-diphosphatase